MNKKDLVVSIAKTAGITKAEAKKALNSTVEAITEAIKRGDSVTLSGFGTFSVAQRVARTGRNPQTGKEIKVKAKKVAKFKAGSLLVKALSGGTGPK